MAHTNEINIYDNAQNIKHMGQLIMFYAKKFRQDNKYSLMILDTSGRNFNNKNLYVEIDTIIHNLRKIEDIHLTVMYNINCLAIHSCTAPQYDGVILSNINEITITSNILNILSTFNAKISLLNSDINSPIELYDNNTIKTYIITKIKNIQKKS